MSDAILDYNKIVDEEIFAYEALKDLYVEKEEVLIKGKREDLFNIDTKILNQAKQIQEIEVRRAVITKALGNEKITLTNIIEKLKTENSELAENFAIQRQKLQDLTKDLKKLQEKHQSLVEHSLKIVEKTIDIIYSVAAPQSEQYDKSGNNTKINENNVISSVIEEV